MAADVIEIGTLVFAGLGATAAAVGVGGVIYAFKTFNFNV